MSSDNSLKDELPSSSPSDQDRSFQSLMSIDLSSIANKSWADYMDEQSQSSYESVDKSTHNESDVIEIKEECVVHEQEKLKTMNDTTAVKLDKPESVHVENANFDTSKCKDEDELQMDSATRKSTRKTLVPKRNIETEPRFSRSSIMSSAMETRQSTRNKERIVENQVRSTLNISTITKHQGRKRASEQTTCSSSNTASSDASPQRRTRKTARYSGSSHSTSTSNDCGFIFRKEKSPSPMTTPQEGWNEPKTGWCFDEKTLERRTKEISRMKERSIYQRYLSEVPKSLRIQKVHPKTPNKHVNHSRRSWDQQVKIWKRNIYAWAGESPTPSVASSYCSSECSDIEQEQNISANFDDEVGSPSTKSSAQDNRLLQDVTITLQNADTVASLLGHFDMDTRNTLSTITEEATLQEERTLTDGESTLKGASKSELLKLAEQLRNSNAPTDFRQIAMEAAKKASK